MSDDRDRLRVIDGACGEGALGHLPEPQEDRALRSMLAPWPAPTPSDGLEVRLLESYRRERASKGRTRQPRTGLVAAAAVLLCSVAVWWVISAAHPTRLSAQELLTRANESAAAQMNRSDVVLWRSIAVEERRLPENTILNRHRVDVWRHGGTRTTVRRVYDARDRLEGGEWIASTGARTLYQPGVAPAHPDADIGRTLRTEDMAWRVDLSPATFAALVPSSGVHLRETPDGFILSWESGADGPWLRAELTLARDDLRAVSQSVTVIDADARTRVIRFRELDARTLSPADVPSMRFEPEPELTAAARPPEAPLSATTARMPRAAAVSEATELQVWHQLHRLGFLFDQTAQLERRAGGQLHIRLVLPPGLGPEALGSGLHALTTLPGVSLDVTRARRARDVTPGGQGAPSPAADLSARVIGLREFLRRWPTDALHRFDDEHVAQWSTIVRDHALAIGERAEQLRTSLPSPSNRSPSTPAPSVHDVTELSAALDALLDAADAALARSRPDTSSEMVTGDGPSHTALWNELLRTESAAAAFSGQWSVRRRP